MDTDALTRDDLIKLMQRSNFVRDQQSQRIGQLLSENLELAAILNELQQENTALRETIASANGDGGATLDAPDDALT
jgi:hypothetical protein